MNKLLSSGILFLLLVNSVAAQKNKQEIVFAELPVNESTGLYEYSKVVELPGTTKDQLYNKAFAWANQYYKNPANVIREKNPEDGKIVIKARFRISNAEDKKGVVTAAGDVMYSLTLGFKEGKYKYNITEINWKQVSYYPIERWKDTTSPSFNSEYPYYLQQTDESIKKVIADLVTNMAQEKKTKSDDW